MCKQKLRDQTQDICIQGKQRLCDRLACRIDQRGRLGSPAFTGLGAAEPPDVPAPAGPSSGGSVSTICAISDWLRDRFPPPECGFSHGWVSPNKANRRLSADAGFWAVSLGRVAAGGSPAARESGSLFATVGIVSGRVYNRTVLIYNSWARSQGLTASEYIKLENGLRGGLRGLFENETRSRSLAACLKSISSLQPFCKKVYCSVETETQVGVQSFLKGSEMRMS